MVLNRKKLLIITTLFTFCCLTACEEIKLVDCSECDTREPSSCLLRIQLEESGDLDDPYDVTIYRGSIEEGRVLLNISTKTSFNYRVALNSLYTVSAKMLVNNKEYTAIDATRPKVEVVTDACEETCYYVINKTVKLSIKYY